MQESVLAALRKGQSHSRPLPWWRTVLRNAFIDGLRSEKRRRRWEERAAECAETTTVGLDEDLRPETELLRAALDHLPVRQAAIVRRLYLEGLSFEESARREGMSARSVRRLRGLAFENLRCAVDRGDPTRASGPRGARMLWPALPWLRRAPKSLSEATVLGTRAEAFFAGPRVLAAALFSGFVLLALMDGGTSPVAHHANAVAVAAHDGRAVPAVPIVQGLGLIWENQERLTPLVDDPGDIAKAAEASPEPLLPAPACGSLQSLIDKAQVGEVLRVPPCIYRETVHVGKPLTLVAEPGAEIRGSDIWNDFVAWPPGANGAQRWASVKTLAPEVIGDNIIFSGRCDSDSVAPCPGTEQVFVEGRPLARIGAPGAVGPGRFAVDAEGHIILGEDPSRAPVEVSVRRFWMTIQANDVTVLGFSMQHASNLGVEQGALFVRLGSRNVKLHHNRFMHASGVAFTAEGTGHSIIDNEIAWAGREGMEIAHTTLAGQVVVQGNRVHHNGGLFALTRQRWINGGISLFYSAATLSGNHIYDNFGVGLFVIASQAPVIQDNDISNNRGAGIASSSSQRALIEGNVLRGNGWGASPVEPAIMMVQSQGFEVRDNEVDAVAIGIFAGPAISPAVPLPGSCAKSAFNTFYNNRIRVPHPQGAVRLGGEQPQEACPNNYAVGNLMLGAGPHRVGG